MIVVGSIVAVVVGVVEFLVLEVAARGVEEVLLWESCCLFCQRTKEASFLCLAYQFRAHPGLFRPVHG